MLDVGCYLTGLALWCSATCTTASMMLAFGLILDSGVAALLLSALRFCITSGASDSATERFII